MNWRNLSGGEVLEWDGKDLNESNLPKGVYFILTRSKKVGVSTSIVKSF